MMHCLYLRMIIQIIYNLQGIAHMALYAEGEGFQSLQEEKRMKGGKGRSRIPENDRTDISYKCRRPCRIRKGYPVIAWVRF